MIPYTLALICLVSYILHSSFICAGTFCRKMNWFCHFLAKKGGDRMILVTAPAENDIHLSSRMSMMKKLIASSTHESQIARSAKAFVSTEPMPAPTANRPITPK